MDPKAFNGIFGMIGVGGAVCALVVVGIGRVSFRFYRNFTLNRRYNSFIQYNPKFGKQLNDLERKEAFKILETKDSKQPFGAFIDKQKRIFEAIDDFGKHQKFD